MRFAPTVVFLALACAATLYAQQKDAAPKKKNVRPHQWVNVPQALPPGVQHKTFRSPSMGIDVGYCIYLPPQYGIDADRRFPVVYWLHGGNGNETTGIRTVTPVADKAIRAGEVPPMIIVYVNGGPAWHYDVPETKQLGETAFIRELIPHIDKTYRTIADRTGRAIEGMSMGGRGTTRDMFKYPELFSSAAPLAAGIQNEQKAVDAGMHKDNVFTLARRYAANPTPPLRILIVVGTADQNYESNLGYMKLLDELNVPHEKIILDGVTHSNVQYYDKLGPATLKFHAESFRRAAPAR